MGLFNRHLTKVAERTLLATPVLYEFANKYPLPGGAGKTLFVPKHVSYNSLRAITEGTVLTPCANSAGYYSATVAGYGDVKGYTDFLEMVREIPTTLTHDIEDMMTNSSLKIDSLVRAQLSGAGTYVAPDGSTATGSVADNTVMKQRFMFDANGTLASKNVPRYADGCYWGAFHPRQIHDLFVNTSAGSQLGTYVAGVAGFLEATEIGAKKLEMATIGKLGGIRIFESTGSPLLTGTTTTGAISADSSGYQAYVMGPGAVAAVDLATAKLRSYVKGLGSAGTADPIDQLMTLGVKFYFASTIMDATRLVKTGSGNATF
jgi:N4-gp56 family major capsid protein